VDTKTSDKVPCSDCGHSFERSTMHWGHNSWAKITSVEYAYVCQTCWDNRAKAMMR
jgi:hypothetical protein